MTFTNTNPEVRIYILKAFLPDLTFGILLQKENDLIETDLTETHVSDDGH